MSSWGHTEGSVVGVFHLSGHGVTLWASLEAAAKFKAGCPAVIIRSNFGLRFHQLGVQVGAEAGVNT